MTPKIISSEKWSLTLIDEELMKYVNENTFEGIYKNKEFFIDKWHTILSKAKETYSQPSFYNYSNLKSGNKT